VRYHVKPSFICALALVVAAPCWGGTGSEPGRIIAPGIAVVDVAPDSLAIDFELETASDSFQQGAAKARTVATDLESIAPPVDGIRLSVSHDLTFMQVKKWTSGTKQEHKFRLLVDGVPDGQAEKAMVAIIQSALAKVANLTVSGFEARLSDGRTKQLQTALLKQAIADAREFASTAAAEANLKVQSVRSLRIGGPGASSRPYELNESVTVEPDYYGNRSRAFSVHDELASKIHVSVKVVVEYDCEPK
jgi:uncharacterized protein YggE